MNTACRKLKIAFVAPNALHDGSSGAALSLLTMLQTLSRCGWDCHSLTATVFDVPPQPQDLAKTMAKWGLQIKVPNGQTSTRFWHGQRNGVTHTLLHTDVQRRLSMTPGSELMFLNVARGWLCELKPDVVLTIGGLVLDTEVRRAARDQGAAIVFYLANPNYRNRQSFDLVDLTITNSNQTAKLYKDRINIDAENVGLFVDTEALTALERKPAYVTFINPVAEKGVAMFLQLVAMAQSRAPDMRFLVVESRGRLLSAIDRLKLDRGLMRQITVLPRQEDMREIFRHTQILLMPSFWFEAAGRVLVEAVASGIPVLATNRGGIPETLAGGGTLLEVPEACVHDHWHLPSEQEAQPWWQALNALYSDQDHYQLMVQRCIAAAQKHDLSAKAQRLNTLLREVIFRRHDRLISGPVAPQI